MFQTEKAWDPSSPEGPGRHIPPSTINSPRGSSLRGSSLVSSLKSQPRANCEARCLKKEARGATAGCGDSLFFFGEEINLKSYKAAGMTFRHEPSAGTIPLDRERAQLPSIHRINNQFGGLRRERTGNQSEKNNKFLVLLHNDVRVAL